MPDKNVTNEDIIRELKASYNMELETVVNYLANSIHLDGVRAMEIRETLQEEVQEELGHATRIAKRLKTIGAHIPGSQEMKWSQSFLQPPKKFTDVQSVIRGVIEAESKAIEQYRKIIEMCDQVDWVTQDLAIELKGDEEEHRRLFEGFLKEYTEA